MQDRLSFLGASVPPAFELRVVSLAPSEELAYREDDWDGALVVVELGELELEGLCGRRFRFLAGDVLWLARLRLRLLRNPGHRRTTLSAVSRRRPATDQPSSDERSQDIP